MIFLKKVFQKMTALLLIAFSFLAIGGQSILALISVDSSAAAASPQVTRTEIIDRSGEKCKWTAKFSWAAYSGADYYQFKLISSNMSSTEYQYNTSNTSFVCSQSDYKTINEGASGLLLTSSGSYRYIFCVIPIKNGVAMTDNITQTESALICHGYPTHYLQYMNGSTLFKSQYVVCSQNNVLISDVPVKSGFTFMGWSESPSATSATYSAGGNYFCSHKTTQKVYLYAVWKKTPTTISVTDITVTPTSKTLTIGGTQQLTATVLPTNATNKTVTYKSSNSSVATVSSTGLVTANAEGSATITVTTTDGGKTASCKIVAVSQPSNKLNPSDIYSFSNSYDYFSTGKYTMLDSDFEKLADYVRGYYGNSSSAQTCINSLQKKRDSDWGGSCYGMSATVLLDKTGHISFNENFDTGAATMSKVKSPDKNARVQSAINYYQISQCLNFARGPYYRQENANWKYGLQNLVENVKSGKTLLFSYWFARGSNYYGHAIVLYDYSLNSDGSHSLVAYDNRYPSQTVTVKVNSSYSTCTVVTPYGNEFANAVEFLDDLSGFDKIDIDGPNNDMVINSPVSTVAQNKTTISVNTASDVTIKNKAGETIIIKDGEVSGTMGIISTHMIVNSTEDGTPAPVTLELEVNDSDSFAFETAGDGLDVSVTGKDIYASADATNADTVVVAKNEGIYLMGDNLTYSASLSLNNDVCDMISMSGTSNSNVSLNYGDDGIIASGVCSDDNTMTVFSNVSDVEKIDFSSEYDDVLIVGASGGKVGDMDIRVSAENNGVYDESLIKKPTVTIQNNPSSKTVKYGDGIKLTAKYADLPTGSQIKWYVNSAEKATGESFTYDNVTSDATITVKIVGASGNVLKNSDGNEVSDTETIKVNSSFWQKIVSFFKNIFGMNRVSAQEIKK